MRSRERLIEVMASVNHKVVGESNTICFLLAAATLKSGASGCVQQCSVMAQIRDETSSPHIRDIATEAIHYLNEAQDAR
jgi:hypothetical protein